MEDFGREALNVRWHSENGSAPAAAADAYHFLLRSDDILASAERFAAKPLPAAISSLDASDTAGAASQLPNELESITERAKRYDSLLATVREQNERIQRLTNERAQIQLQFKQQLTAVHEQTRSELSHWQRLNDQFALQLQIHARRQLQPTEQPAAASVSTTTTAATTTAITSSLGPAPIAPTPTTASYQ